MVAAGLVAASPGVLVLHVLSRLADVAQDPRALSVLGIAGVLLPFLGALLGGLGVAMLSGRGWEYGALAGLASQLPAVPGYLQVLSTALGLAYYLDAAVYTALFLSYLVLSLSIGANAAGWWQTRGEGGVKDMAMFLTKLNARALASLTLLAIALLGFALFTLSNPGAPWFYAVFLGLAASVVLLTVVQVDQEMWLRRVALALLIISLAVTGLAVVLVVSLAL